MAFNAIIHPPCMIVSRIGKIGGVMTDTAILAIGSRMAERHAGRVNAVGIVMAGRTGLYAGINRTVIEDTIHAEAGNTMAYLTVNIDDRVARDRTGGN